MLLKRLQIQNLRSYEDQEITFPEGSTLLSGDIGSGKTTILLAIEFALFGLQPSQKANSLLNNSKDEAKVKLEFEIEGKQIIIERTLKRSKKSISQDYSSITIDNEKFEGAVTEIKSKILGLLNYPKEFAKKTNLLYKFTVYTPQEEMKQIILESGDIRLNTLRHVFGIDKYKRIQENTSLLTSKLREKTRINEALVQDLDEIKEQLKQKQDSLINLKQDKTKTEQDHQISTDLKIKKEQALNEIQTKIEEKKALEGELSKSEMMISEKQQQVTSLNNTINIVKQQIKEAEKSKFNENEYNGIDQRINFQKNKEEDLQKQYIELTGKINSYESKKQELDSLKNKLSGLKKCPTCLQEVSDEYKNNMQTNAERDLEQINKSLIELTIQKNKLIQEIELTKKSKQEFEAKKQELELLKVKLESLNEKQQRITEIETQVQSLNKDLHLLNNQTKTFGESIKDYEKYTAIFQEREKELTDAKNNENQLAIKKAEINKEIQFTEQQISEKKETLIVPIFGQGRALLVLKDDEITKENIFDI